MGMYASYMNHACSIIRNAYTICTGLGEEPLTCHKRFCKRNFAWMKNKNDTWMQTDSTYTLYDESGWMEKFLAADGFEMDCPKDPPVGAGARPKGSWSKAKRPFSLLRQRKGGRKK